MSQDKLSERQQQDMAGDTEGISTAPLKRQVRSSTLPLASMATYKTEPYTFTAYAHEDWEEEFQWQQAYDQIKAQDPEFEMDMEDFMEAVGRPLYEVKVICEVSFKDGTYAPIAEVKIVGAE